MTSVVERGRAWRGAHAAVAEVGIAVAAAILVTVVAVSQWGATSDAFLRGLTLGTWLGVVVWLVARRRRVAEERVRRQGEMARVSLRLELARELHDTLAGEVAAIGIQAAAARRVMDAQPAEAAAAMQRIEVASRAANADLRRMLEALRSGDDASLAAAPGLGALPALAEAQTLGRAGAISVAIDGDVAAAIDTALDRTAYRIAEEAIRNARRHAGPVAVDVTARIEAGELYLVIENAPGRTPADEGGSGLGLVGMRERAAVFGGSIDARPTLPGGFRVEARLPIVERRASAGAGGVIRLVLADDQAMVRSGLRLLLEAEQDIEVVGEVADGAAAVEEVRWRRPDIVLMDVQMPGMDGLEATRRIVASGPLPRVVILTTFDLDEYLFEALRAGASGFLLKHAPADELIAAVRTVAAGNALLAPAVTGRVISTFARRGTPSPELARRLDRLSEREREVLVLAARGRSNAEIAADLVVGEATVKTHLSSVFAKLGLRDRVAAVVFAYESGLVEPGEATAGDSG